MNAEEEEMRTRRSFILLSSWLFVGGLVFLWFLLSSWFHLVAQDANRYWLEVNSTVIENRYRLEVNSTVIASKPASIAAELDLIPQQTFKRRATIPLPDDELQKLIYFQETSPPLLVPHPQSEPYKFKGDIQLPFKYNFFDDDLWSSVDWREVSFVAPHRMFRFCTRWLNASKTVDFEYPNLKTLPLLFDVSIDTLLRLPLPETRQDRPCVVAPRLDFLGWREKMRQFRPVKSQLIGACELIPAEHAPGLQGIMDKCIRDRAFHEGNAAASAGMLVYDDPFALPVLVALAHAYVTELGTVFTKHFIYKPRGYCLHPHELYRRRNLLQKYPSGGSFPVFVPRLLHLAGIWTSNVWHAYMNSASRIGFHLEEILNDPTLYIFIGNNYLDVLQAYRMLRMMGVAKERFIYDNVYADTVFIPSAPLGCHNTPGPFHTIPFRNHLLKAIHAIRAEDATMIRPIVVFARSNYRIILNHDAIMTALRTAFPNEIFAELHDHQLPSPRHIWHTMARAKAIISPHGAGLANLIAVPPGVPVLEFLTPKWFSLTSMRIARELSLPYTGVVIANSTNKKNDGFWIEPNSVVNWLRQNLY